MTDWNLPGGKYRAYMKIYIPNSAFQPLFLPIEVNTIHAKQKMIEVFKTQIDLTSLGFANNILRNQPMHNLLK